MISHSWPFKIGCSSVAAAILSRKFTKTGLCSITWERGVLIGILFLGLDRSVSFYFQMEIVRSPSFFAFYLYGSWNHLFMASTSIFRATTYNQNIFERLSIYDNQTSRMWCFMASPASFCDLHWGCGRSVGKTSGGCPRLAEPILPIALRPPLGVLDGDSQSWCSRRLFTTFLLPGLLGQPATSTERSTRSYKDSYIGGAPMLPSSNMSLLLSRCLRTTSPSTRPAFSEHKLKLGERKLFLIRTSNLGETNGGSFPPKKKKPIGSGCATLIWTSFLLTSFEIPDFSLYNFIYCSIMFYCNLYFLFTCTLKSLLSLYFSIETWNLSFLLTFLLKPLLSLYFSFEIPDFSLLFYWIVYFFIFFIAFLYFSIEISTFALLVYWNLYFLFTFLLEFPLFLTFWSVSFWNLYILITFLLNFLFFVTFCPLSYWNLSFLITFLVKPLLSLDFLLKSLQQCHHLRGRGCLDDDSRPQPTTQPPDPLREYCVCLSLFKCVKGREEREEERRDARIKI